MTNYSRSAWGARPARGGPGNLDPAVVEGIAVHWPGMSGPIRTVKGVMAALRGWQAFHMDGRGWSDIAYQVAVDQMGNRYELRGLATQSGANGDTGPNERFGALLLILAPGEEPSEAMAAEVRSVVADHRALFPNSRRVATHRDVRPDPTECPGPAATAAIRAGRFDPTTAPKDWFDMATEAELRKVVREEVDAILSEKQANGKSLRENIRVGANARDLARAILDTLKGERA